MRSHDEKDGKRKDIQLIFMPYLLGSQQQQSHRKQQPGTKMPVMPAETMKKRQAAHQKGQPDHPILERGIVNDIHPHDGQAHQQQRQDRTMDGTKHRSRDPQNVPIDFT